MNFQLDHLDAALLEEVITKFERTDYFRLQRTCSWMNEFIRSSRNISVRLEGRCTLEVRESGRSIKVRRHGWCDIVTPGEILYGIQIRTLTIKEGETYYESIPEFLKKTRITCEELMLLGVPGWDSEVCGKLLNVLKPATVALNSQPPNSTRYEALLHSMIPKTVRVVLPPDEAATAVPKLLSAFPNVKITVLVSENSMNLFFSILEFLRSAPLPNLRKFQLTIEAKGRMPSKATLEELFPNLSWPGDRTSGEIFACLEMLPHPYKILVKRSSLPHMSHSFVLRLGQADHPHGDFFSSYPY